MPLYLRSNPVGIDARIVLAQTYMYDRLKVAWGITNDANINCFGRVYKNQTNDGYTPEVKAEGRDYHDTFLDDKVAATVFFGLGETVESEDGYNIADVSAIFMVNLDMIKPGDDRKDEEAKLDVQKIFNRQIYGFAIQSFKTGIDSVFAEYSGWKKKDGIKFKDMHPFFNFRVNFKVRYKLII